MFESSSHTHTHSRIHALKISKNGKIGAFTSNIFHLVFQLYGKHRSLSQPHNKQHLPMPLNHHNLRRSHSFDDKFQALTLLSSWRFMLLLLFFLFFFLSFFLSVSFNFFSINTDSVGYTHLSAPLILLIANIGWHNQTIVIAAQLQLNTIAYRIKCKCYKIKRSLALE